jgi:hypothetical protein
MFMCLPIGPLTRTSRRIINLRVWPFAVRPKRRKPTGIHCSAMNAHVRKKNWHQAVILAFVAGEAPMIALIRRSLKVSMVAEVGTLFRAIRAKRSRFETCRLQCTLCDCEANDVRKRKWQRKSVKKEPFMPGDNEEIWV